MKLTFILLFLSMACFSQPNGFVSEDITINQFVDGTLLRSDSQKNLPLVLIIPGSGPTDRNGNQNFLKNNSLKKLAEALAENDIQTFRMDKRIVKQIKRGNVNLDIKFDDFVTDVRSIVDYFRKDSTYKKIYILGHSQGSLVGMLAADSVDGFISVAGAGRSIDKVLLDQVNKTAPMFNDDTSRVLAILKEGKTTSEYPQALASIFNREIQPFMISWIQYNPQEVIKNLEIPVLIINGTKDLQVTEEEAQLLNESANNSTYKMIPNMNHVMFIIDGDDLENSKSYNESQRKISQELVETVIGFITDNE